MSEITWEEPPEITGGRPRVWLDRLAPLRKRPGKWANLGEHNLAYVTNINTGRVAGLQPGEFEATSRAGSNGKGTLYVRYVGTNGSASSS